LKAWISDTPAPVSSPPKHEEQVWRQWREPTQAIDWAVKMLPGYSRSELPELFDSMSPGLDGKKAPAWQDYIEDLMNKEKARSDFEL